MPQFSLRQLSTAFFILIVPSLLYAQGRILHSPPPGVEIGKDVEIIASVENSSTPVSELNVLYRQRGFQSYKEFSMFESSGFWSVTIPGSEVTDAGLEYLIVADLQGGGQLAYPENNPYDQPVFIATLIVKAAELTEAAIKQGAVSGSNMIILSPEPNSRTRVEEVLIAVSLFYNDEIDLSSISIFLNGINVTAGSDISEELITYVPEKIEPGIKTVIIEASDTSGEPLIPLQWDFRVVSDKKRTESRFKISGRAFVDSRSDKIQGQTDDVSISRVSFRGSYDFVSYKGLAYVTSKENEFLQPKNRFMFGLKTKYLTFNFGDLNPNVTPLTIYGKRVRGIEGNLELGYFNLHTVYGELEREIPADISLITELLVVDINGDGEFSKADGDSFVDLNSNGKRDKIGDVLRGGTFGRTLLAIRPSFGSRRSFQWGLTFAKARDDSLIKINLPDRINPQGVSLLSGRPSRFDYITPDNETVFVDLGRSPKDNLLLGTDLFLGFDNNRFILEGEGAFSLLARDITGGPFTKLGLDTLTDDVVDGKIGDANIPFDPADLEGIFILNQSIIPLDPRGLTSVSYNTGLKLNYFKHFVRANYRFVGSEYNSLANPFIRKDIKGFNVSDRIRMLNNKFIVSIRFERLENNLAGEKETTTTTTSFDGGISLYPGRDMPRISLNVRNYLRDNGVDTTRIDTSIGLIDRREENATVTSTFSIGYDVEALGYKHKVNLNVSNSERTDEFRMDRDSSFTSSEFSSTQLALVVNTEYDFPLKTQVQFLTNKNETVGLSKFTYTVFGVGGEYLMLNKKLRLNGNLKFSTTSGTVEFNESRLSGGARYSITVKQSILASAEFAKRVQSAGEGKPDETFNDFIIRARYAISF